MIEQNIPNNSHFEQNTDYLIFHNIESCSHRRPLARWPLHITIVPPFCIPVTNEDKLRSLVREIAADYEPIRLQPGSDVKFGPSFDRNATTVTDSSGKLKSLHEHFMQSLGSIECSEVDTTYANERYAPHFTWQRGVFPPTSSFALNSLSIAKKTDGVKTMLETVRLEY